MSACQEARKNQLASSKFQTLTAVDATELDAIAERILPATDSPGASDAGVIYFFDNVLRDRVEALNILKNGLLFRDDIILLRQIYKKLFLHNSTE